MGDAGAGGDIDHRRWPAASRTHTHGLSSPPVCRQPVGIHRGTRRRRGSAGRAIVSGTERVPRLGDPPSLGQKAPGSRSLPPVKAVTGGSHSVTSDSTSLSHAHTIRHASPDMCAGGQGLAPTPPGERQPHSRYETRRRFVTERSDCCRVHPCLAQVTRYRTQATGADPERLSPWSTEARRHGAGSAAPRRDHVSHRCGTGSTECRYLDAGHLPLRLHDQRICRRPSERPTWLPAHSVPRRRGAPSPAGSPAMSGRPPDAACAPGSRRQTASLHRKTPEPCGSGVSQCGDGGNLLVPALTCKDAPVKTAMSTAWLVRRPSD
jgi:hypothetical protein